MAKEALFNILQNSLNFDDLSVLDLYAGTGNISYEFASRGCPAILAVDSNTGCVRFIDDTARRLGLPISAVRRDALDFLERNSVAYDIIFADPPYEQPEANFIRLHELVFKNNFLKENGLLIIEHSSQTDLSKLRYFEQVRKYGGSRFSFFTQ